MADLPFVDTHVHFYDLQHPDITYSWLQPGVIHPLIGDIDAIKALRFDASNYRAESRFSNVTKVVHVQAALGSADPVRETEWLEEMADRSGFPDAIVAHSDLSSDTLEKELERHAVQSRLRGIRDFGRPGFLVDPSWQRGFAALEKFGLLCDLDCRWEDMDNAARLAKRFPGVPMVLEHVGFPQSRSDEYFQNWKTGMATLATADSALCKLSGLGMCDQAWTVDSIRPWILSAIELFGVERCFFGTNWPVDRLFSSFDPLIEAYTSVISDFSLSEREALFYRNAERTYRI